MAIVPPTSVGSGSITLVASSTLGAPAATIDITGISASYSHLQYVFLGATSDAAPATVNMTFNGDAGANYDYGFVFQNGVVISGSETYGSTFAIIQNIPPSTAANMSGIAAVWIPQYAGSSFHKEYISVGYYQTGVIAGSLHGLSQFGRWRSTAAITRITIAPSAGNFITGSTVSLYGMA